jgi:putative acetyltransferase
MIAIRRAREADFDALARVWFEGYLASAGDAPVPAEVTQAVLRARIPGDIEARGWDLYAAEAGDRIVAILAIIRAEKALDQIFVGDGWRSRGVGKALLDFVKREMPDGFWLRTHILNTSAQGFYENEGMTHTRDAPHPRHPEEMFRYYAWKDQGISARKGCPG